jgi:hypothetical protein
MKSIWMGIAPNSHTTRVIAMAGADQTLLKAQLARQPKHPRALPTLLEAIALWQGLPVRAALCAEGGGASCDSTICREASFDLDNFDDGAPLYSIVWVPAGAHRKRRQRLHGLGSFQDLEQLVLSEVAR